MTARNPTSLAPGRKRTVPPLPDVPDPEERMLIEGELTTFEHLHHQGSVHHIIQHFGNRDTTIIGSDRYMSPAPTTSQAGLLNPDLLIAFNADPQLYDDNNGYIISEQGKPPDFVLEVASSGTGRRDIGVKRNGYEAWGIPEYWRFDKTGQYHRTRLAGDRLVDGQYQPIPIETLEDGSLQGYSAVLHLNLRWEDGQLGWYDSDMGLHIVRFDDLKDLIEEERSRADNERDARLRAEARVRELEEELNRLRNT